MMFGWECDIAPQALMLEHLFSSCGAVLEAVEPFRRWGLVDVDGSLG